MWVNLSKFDSKYNIPYPIKYKSSDQKVYLEMTMLMKKIKRTRIT